jgi:hypothetical protein
MYFPLKKNRASASVLLLAFKMRQWDAGKKQGGTLQGGFLDFLLTHFELFAFCFMLKPCYRVGSSVDSEILQ